MSLLGEKCDRCGKRTRHKEDEHPICEDCAREMALMMEASSETLRACPADGEQMTKQIAHMLVIDRCPKCQGVWLDGGELERLQGGIEAEALRAMTVGFTHPFS